MRRPAALVRSCLFASSLLIVACGADDEPGDSGGVSTLGSSTGTGSTSATTTSSGGTSGTDDGGDGDGGDTGDGDTTSGGDGDATTAGDGDASTGDGDGDGTTEPNWSMTHIDYYSGGTVTASVDLDDCVFCDVNDVGTHTLLRYEQDGGYTIWALYVPNGSTTGTQALTQDYSGAYATLSANSSTLPSEAQGMYFGDTNVGSLTLTSFDSSPGGIIAGSIDATMTKGAVTARLTATFQGTMP